MAKRNMKREMKRMKKREERQSLNLSQKLESGESFIVNSYGLKFPVFYSNDENYYENIVLEETLCSCINSYSEYVKESLKDHLFIEKVRERKGFETFERIKSVDDFRRVQREFDYQLTEIFPIEKIESYKTFNEFVSDQYILKCYENIRKYYRCKNYQVSDEKNMENVETIKTNLYLKGYLKDSSICNLDIETPVYIMTDQNY